MFNDIWYAVSHSTDIINIIKRRKSQLYDQERIDDALKNKCTSCPIVVNRLFYYDRCMNRNFTDSTSVQDYIESVQNNYENIQNHHSNLFRAMSSFCPCETLNLYLDEIISNK